MSALLSYPQFINRLLQVAKEAHKATVILTEVAPSRWADKAAVSVKFCTRRMCYL